MSGYRVKNQLLLAEPEAASGTEESPSVGANAIKVRAPIQYSPNFDALDTDTVTGSLSQSAPVVGGGNVGLRTGCYLKGSGAGGTAPDYGALLRGCGLSQTTTAADVTGTAQAGGASTITLAAGASAVDDAYAGMVIRTTGGTGSGQARVISDYVGATKVATVVPAWTVQPDATTTFSIDANVLYRPASAGLETLTLWTYQHHNDPGQDSRRRRIAGAAGNVSGSVTPRALATLDFAFTGILPAAPDDVARPSDPTYQAQDPEPFVNALAYLGGAPVKFAEFSFDLGNRIEMPDDPAAAHGFDYAQVVARAAAGRIVPNLVLVSSRDAFSDWLASASRSLWLRWGSAAGKR
ncbi:MAG: hypothetical protein HY521_13065, partial [Proteobacteria bacterium]|nr:hypothetical protein [Pseudomonadota bacterium]